MMLAWVWSEQAWARAGGGGGFGGGGGGGGGGFGGGGGSGGGGGDLIWLLVYLCIHYPLVGYPLAAGIVALIVWGGIQGNQHRVTRTIRRGRQRQGDRIRQAAIADIRQRDPDFRLESFLSRVQTAFTKIQSAWSEQDLRPVRPFISDGIHERFSLQIGMQKAAGFRNVMERVTIHSCDAVAVYSGGQFHTIHVRISASASDYNSELKSGRKLSGTENNGEFVEFWSFHRRPGAKSLQANGTIEGNCPRCGALLELVDRAKCDSCGAQVNSGEYDWVLTEITQQQEWRVPGQEIQLPGVAQIQQHDPAFNTQHIEDRVSVMFWRMRAAEFYHDPQYARPVLLPAYLEKFKESLGPASPVWEEPAVGIVELVDAQPGGEGQMDRLRVKIRWSGILVDSSSGTKRVVREKTIYTHVFVLVRKHGATSTPAETFTSAGCPSCGAPIDVNREGACVYCGALLTEGDFDWVLEDVQPFTLAMAVQHQRAMTELGNRVIPAPTDPELSLAVLARVMLVDGHLDSREGRALAKLGSRRGLTQEQVNHVIQHAAASEVEIPMPKTSQESTAFLEQLVQVALADGQVGRREKQLLATYASRAGLSGADVRLAIARVRSEAYRQARNELRGRP